jgi:3-deoxy-manno-octulosonate cytidylyltransferase (CMP-KDO synthetase)
MSERPAPETSKPKGGLLTWALGVAALVGVAGAVYIIGQASTKTAPEVATVAVIPARYGATRFPGKPLAPLRGKPMVQHVWERCRQSEAFTDVVVATDDARIADAVKAFGGKAVMTSSECPSGTDRVAQVAQQMPDAEVFINVQGDEPLVHPESLQTLASAFSDPDVEMATLVRPLDAAELENPNVVKVVKSTSTDMSEFTPWGFTI